MIDGSPIDSGKYAMVRGQFYSTWIGRVLEKALAVFGEIKAAAPVNPWYSEVVDVGSGKTGSEILARIDN